MEKLDLKVIKLLFFRFSTIYGTKFTKDYLSENDLDRRLVQLWWHDWTEGLAGVKIENIKGALKYCNDNLSWPPNVIEFRRLCEHDSGLPTLQESFKMAVRRDFTHPVIKLAYDKIGSWSMRNNKEAELLLKFKKAYEEAIRIYRIDPQKCLVHFKKVTEEKTTPALFCSALPAERKSFKESLKALQKKMSIVNEKISHPKWEKQKITRNHKLFDEIIYKQRKTYLLSLNEYEAHTLECDDKYDRIRYLRGIESIKQRENVLRGS